MDKVRSRCPASPVVPIVTHHDPSPSRALFSPSRRLYRTSTARFLPAHRKVVPARSVAGASSSVRIRVSSRLPGIAFVFSSPLWSSSMFPTFFPQSKASVHCNESCHIRPLSTSPPPQTPGRSLHSLILQLPRGGRPGSPGNRSEAQPKRFCSSGRKWQLIYPPSPRTCW